MRTLLEGCSWVNAVGTLLDGCSWANGLATARRDTVVGGLSSMAFHPTFIIIGPFINNGMQ